MLSPDQARELIADAQFIWHQRFELAPGVVTPGANDVAWLLETSGLRSELEGRTVLDIGTTNGGMAFMAEQAGASRVVAVDLMPPEQFGFDVLSKALGSDVEFVQASAYELPGLLCERFDVVIFWGVLYHMRHPLLALDALYRLTGEVASIETAVADAQLPRGVPSGMVRFYRRDELGNDPSNWFAPNVDCLTDWCASSGLEPYHVTSWPESKPSRALVNVRPVEVPEYQRVSYEVPIGVERLR